MGSTVWGDIGGRMRKLVMTIRVAEDDNGRFHAQETETEAAGSGTTIRAAIDSLIEELEDRSFWNSLIEELEDRSFWAGQIKPICFEGDLNGRD